VVRHAGGDVKAPKIRVFDSALDAVADVVAGKADVCAVTAASATKEIAAGAMRALAVSAPQRLAGAYARTPTWIEQSVDCVIGAWRGVSGARAITRAQIGFWEGILAAAVATGEWRDALENYYWTPLHVAGAALREQLRRERVERKAMLGELGLL
jgi:putative tricarboxylic transport membrane protein